MSSRGDRVVMLLSAALGAGALPSLVRVVRLLPLHVPLDYNEGWNAYQAAAAWQGTLYPRHPAFFFTNYPPLSFFIVGGIGAFGVDAIVAGRIVALVSFCAVAMMLGVAARRFGCTPGEAAFGVSLFVAVTLALSHYVGIDDPQFLGQAVSLAGLIVLLGNRTRATGAAVLMATALFVKHNVIALPVSCVAWLWLRDRRAAVRVGGVFVGLALAGAAMCGALFGSGFMEGLATPRAYSASVAALAFVRWAIRVPAFAAALVLLLRSVPDDEAVQFCAIYAAVASAAGIGFLGGDGVDWNVMFESNWACCLIASVALNRLASRRGAWALAFAALPAVAGTAAIVQSRLEPASSLQSRIDAAPRVADGIALIARQPGTALCETLAFCYWAGKAPEVDLFGLTQHVLHGSRSPDAIVAAVKAGSYGAVQLRREQPPLGPAFRDALTARYDVARSGPDGTIYVVRSGRGAAGR